MNAAFKENYLSDRQAGMRKLRILVAPLDWGLGHAARCIPAIYELIKQDCEVWLAAEGAQEVMLRSEFPTLNFLTLEGYRVRYNRSGSLTGMAWKILRQTPKILAAIRQENEWLKQMVREYAFDAVISDNRYGLYHPGIPCIFMTHQLTIKSSLKWIERLLQKRNYKYINQFTACWVPDEEDKENSLGGELSHPQRKPMVPVHYTGLLSRLNGRFDATNKKDHLLIVLSGPEPQRTILENKIIHDIVYYNGSATIVRGLPASVTIIPSTNSIQFYNHLSAEEMSREMQQAEYIICRSGYSSIMDITKLGKKSILIPTPGQTEQEYLGNYLMQKQWAYCVTQRNFKLDSALTNAKLYPYQALPLTHTNKLQGAVAQLLASLR